MRQAGSNILHICGYHGFRNHLEWYKDYPFLAVNVANHVEGITLGKEKKLFGGRAVIGGFGQTENDLIYKGSEEEIRSEGEDFLMKAGRRGFSLVLTARFQEIRISVIWKGSGMKQTST